MRTTIRRAAVLVSTIVLLTGCGGGDGGDGGAAFGGRPSVDEISRSIKDGMSGLGVAPSQADCAAKVVVGSDLSDNAVSGYLPPDDPGYYELPGGEFTDSDRIAFRQVVAELETMCGLQQAAG